MVPLWKLLLFVRHDQQLVAWNILHVLERTIGPENFYGIDPDKVPKPAAWKLGVALAQEMLDSHVESKGSYPQKVSFVIWGDETLRHEGILESQIFYLLGTRPKWNDRGKLVDVEVIPASELQRPRVDIVIASAAEGMFNNVTLMMDKAVQMVKALDEPENYVRDHYLATRDALIELGPVRAPAATVAGGSAHHRRYRTGTHREFYLSAIDL